MNCIKNILEAKGIKQVWLAQKLGKGYNMVNSYVQNRRQPSIETLYKISELLHVDIRDLIVSNKKQIESNNI
jgi:transcriptional regulator with XRE-family HTH domain